MQLLAEFLIRETENGLGNAANSSHRVDEVDCCGKVYPKGQRPDVDMLVGDHVIASEDFDCWVAHVVAPYEGHYEGRRERSVIGHGGVLVADAGFGAVYGHMSKEVVDSSAGPRRSEPLKNALHKGRKRESGQVGLGLAQPDADEQQARLPWIVIRGRCRLDLVDAVDGVTRGAAGRGLDLHPGAFPGEVSGRSTPAVPGLDHRTDVEIVYAAAEGIKDEQFADQSEDDVLGDLLAFDGKFDQRFGHSEGAFQVGVGLLAEEFGGDERSDLVEVPKSRQEDAVGAEGWLVLAVPRVVLHRRFHGAGPGFQLITRKKQFQVSAAVPGQAYDLSSGQPRDDSVVTSATGGNGGDLVEYDFVGGQGWLLKAVAAPARVAENCSGPPAGMHTPAATAGCGCPGC